MGSLLQFSLSVEMKAVTDFEVKAWDEIGVINFASNIRKLFPYQHQLTWMIIAAKMMLLNSVTTILGFLLSIISWASFLSFSCCVYDTMIMQFYY